MNSHVNFDPKLVREDLLQKREELQKRAEHLLHDKSHHDQNDEVIDALDEIDHQELKAIDAALERLEKGQYGICISCGGKIFLERLHALPYALRCLSCETNH